MTDAVQGATRLNPYVGPRSFEPFEANQFFGRDRDALQLFELLLAERVVLLHSPSGAGKTSLIRAKLIPMMQSEGFHVYPPIRVNEAPPAGWSFLTQNRYVRSVMTCLEADHKAGTRKGMSFGGRVFAMPTLAEYLAKRREALLAEQAAQGTESRFVPELLIFDQFEEILTINVLDHDARLEFFEHLCAALIPRHRWAVFAMREEYLAAIESHLTVLPSALGARHRLDLLTENAATDAIVKPAGLPSARGEYTEKALKRLLTNLRTITGTGSDGSRLDRLIEPVHLQVACCKVWDAAMGDAKYCSETIKIEESHVEHVGDVDGALRAYYAGSVTAAAQAGRISEAKIRKWIGTDLITRGIRTQVLKGTETDRGISAVAATLLEDKYIIRVENRRNAVWYELAHDRLIDPVRKDNRDWFFARKEGDLHRQAEIWNRNGRPISGLLLGDMLKKAKEMVTNNPDSETPELADFLAASNAFAGKTRKRRGAVVVLFIALLMIGLLREIADNKTQKAQIANQDLTLRSLKVWKDSAISVTQAARAAAWRLPEIAQHGSVLAQSIHADSAIHALMSRGVTHPALDTIRYFSKLHGPLEAQSALVALGFPVTIKESPAESGGTNSISFGNATDPANRQLLALALVRAGVGLKRICAPLNGNSGPHVLQVYGTVEGHGLPPITVSQITSMSADSPSVHCNNAR